MCVYLSIHMFRMHVFMFRPGGLEGAGGEAVDLPIDICQFVRHYYYYYYYYDYYYYYYFYYLYYYSCDYYYHYHNNNYCDYHHY